MTDHLRLRRHLYEQLRATRHGSRARRALRRQIALVATGSHDPGGGTAGVREPRRPAPTSGPGRLTR